MLPRIPASSTALFPALVLLFAAAPGAQERAPLDVRTWGVVYDVPGTARVRVQKDVPYHTSNGRTLALDICLPPDAKAPLPAVVFLNGIGDQLPDRVKEWGIYATWPRLVAAHGLAGVSMDADATDVPGSLAAVFGFLEREGARHGIDGKRLGVYAASANVSESSRFLLRAEAPKSVLSAVFYYGSPEIPVARRDLAVLCVTAEGDLVRTREALDAAWSRTLAAGAPWTFELASGLPHAFDAFSDNEASRRTIQRTLAFWKSTLEPVPEPPWEPSPARATLAALYGNDEAESLRLLGEWIAAHPDQPDGYARRGMLLGRLQRGPQAKPDLEQALALGSTEAGVIGTLGLVLAYEGRHAPAVEHLQRAIAGGWFGGEIYAHLAHSQLVLGQNEVAVRSYEEAFRLGLPQDSVVLGNAHYNLACGYARLGRVPEALASVERAVEAGFGTRQTYTGDPDLAPLKEEERFDSALERLAR
jgi:tetratricopeptide (TPR) repeat protein